jgi:hypothetical protein
VKGPSVKRTYALAILSIAFVVAGCHGTPSQLDACKHFCDKQGDCVQASSADVAACKANCDANSATWNDNDHLIEMNCSNADSVKQQIYDCYGNYCDTTLAKNCADAVAQTKCNPK